MNQIYVIPNSIDNKVYVGKTKRGLDVRLGEHFEGADKGVKSHFYSAIRKYGKDNFKGIRQLCQADRKELANLYEIYLISFYRQLLGKENVYNMTNGGEGGPGGIKGIKRGPMSEEQKAKHRIAISKRDYHHSEETLAKLRVPHSKECIENMKISQCKRVIDGGNVHNLGKKRIHNIELNCEKLVDSEKVKMYLDDGWLLGRLEDFMTIDGRERSTLATLGSKRMYNLKLNRGTSVRPEKVQEYLNDGWLLGMLPRKTPKRSIKGRKQIYNVKLNKKKFVEPMEVKKYLDSGWVL